MYHACLRYGTSLPRARMREAGLSISAYEPLNLKQYSYSMGAQCVTILPALIQMEWL